MIDLLKETNIFKGLRSDELEKVVNISNIVEFHDRDQIFKAGDNATSLYIVCLGKVKLNITVDHINASIDLTIDSMKKGDIFGWSAITQPYKYKFSAYASGNTKLLHFQADKMKILCDESDHIGYVIMNNITTIISDRFTRTEGLLKHIIQTTLEK